MHEVARLIGEMLMENVNMIESLRLNFDKLKLIKLENFQMALVLKI